MLTLKSGSYTLDELKAMRNAVGLGHAGLQQDLDCDDECRTCPYRKACEDLYSLHPHITDIIDRETRKTRDAKS